MIVRALVLTLALLLLPLSAARATSLLSLDAAEGSLDRYYTTLFDLTGHDYDPPTVVFVETGELATSACGLATDQAAQYCPLDQSIFLGEVTMDAIADEFGAFAPFFVLAHEWGHHVQHEAGLDRSILRKDGAWNRIYPIASELMADCLAGAWTRHVAASGDLDTMDLPNVVLLAHSVGSEIATPGNHGTGQQRAAATLVGYTQGMVGCMAIEPLPMMGEGGSSDRAAAVVH